MTDEPSEQRPDVVATARDAADAAESETAARPSRRMMLRGAALAGVAVPFLAACGGAKDGRNGASGTDSAFRVPTSRIPEGGGVVFDSDSIVVTQPQAGEFKAFTNICTHMGCPVADVSDGTINCNCHGSMFSIQDGSVVNGPATQPLPKRRIIVQRKEIETG